MYVKRTFWGQFACITCSLRTFALFEDKSSKMYMYNAIFQPGWNVPANMYISSFPADIRICLEHSRSIYTHVWNIPGLYTYMSGSFQVHIRRCLKNMYTSWNIRGWHTRNLKHSKPIYVEMSYKLVWIRGRAFCT